jgi:hypothetical protein
VVANAQDYGVTLISLYPLDVLDEEPLLVALGKELVEGREGMSCSSPTPHC